MSSAAIQSAPALDRLGLDPQLAPVIPPIVRPPGRRLCKPSPAGTRHGIDGWQLAIVIVNRFHLWNIGRGG
jgi:hypothetical protein